MVLNDWMKQVFTFLLIVLCSVSGAQVVRSGLISYYPFAGNADDIVSGHHAELIGATTSTDRFGNESHSFALDGVDDLIKFNDKTLKIMENEYSISLWIYSEETAKKDKKELTVAYSKGWHHIVVSTGSSGRSYFYLDNRLIDSSRASSSQFGQQSMYIRGNNDKLPFFKGKMDDIRVYNRALRAAEVDTLFNEPNPVKAEDIEAGLDEEEEMGDFSVFPNPAKSNIYIAGYVTYSRAEILDILGQQTHEVEANEKKIDVSDLENGLYLVRLYNDDELIGIKKFVVEK